MQRTLLILLLSLLSRLAAADDIAVFYALDADLKALKAAGGEVGAPAVVGSASIHRLRVGDHSVYAVKMGSGAVETALSAQALLARFRCDRAISVGPAGALHSGMKRGIWHRVARVAAWQKGSLTASGLAEGRAAVWTFDPPQPEDESVPEAWRTNAPIALASGEAFVASESARDGLRSATGADAVDMNTFGLAAACADHDVPLHVWRIISDFANDNASDTFRDFCGNYDGEGGRLAAEWIARLPPNPDAPESYPAIRRLLEGEEGKR